MRKKNIPVQEFFFIVNPQAAKRKWDRRKKLRDYLEDKLSGEIIHIHGSKSDTIEKAKKMSLAHTKIVAVGGDGTVADVIQGIIQAQRGRETTLGILPFGSGNAFRKSLGIPKNVKKAVNFLYKGTVREIDLISIEGKTAGFASIGATAKVTEVKLQHKIQGLFGHLLAARILFTIPTEEREIELIDGIDDSGMHFDKKILNIGLFDCVVGKTNYFGYSWKIAPKAKIDDGFLDITLFETSWLKYLLCFPLIYSGFFQRTQRHFKAKKMIIRGQNLPVQYNGEFLGSKDKIECEILPQALKVIAK
jgi:diacylglycerol kinase (ATP)